MGKEDLGWLAVGIVIVVLALFLTYIGGDGDDK